MANRGLTAIPNAQLLDFLNSKMRDKFNRVGLIGVDGLDDKTLKALLENTAGLTYAKVQKYIFAEYDADATYFDDSGIFTAVVDMTNEDSYDKHLYGVILMSDDKLVATVAKTPIIYLNEQIGGQFPIKIPIKGNAGEVVFRSSKYLTAIEAEELFFLPTISVFSLEAQRVADSLEAKIKQVNGG